MITDPVRADGREHQGDEMATAHMAMFPWPMDSRRKWYVAQTKPRCETRVIGQLQRRAADVETFLPKIELIRRRQRRRVAVLEPLFPGYVFMQMHLNPVSWNAVRWTPGVRQVLGNAGWPAEVSEELIETIVQRMEGLGFVRVGLNLTVGMRVRVTTGPFAGLEGVFERPTSRAGRVRVLLDLLGAPRRLVIDPLDLERV